jgi:hypothetical protein
MLAEKKTATNVGVLLGLVLQFVGRGMMAQPGSETLGLLLVLVGLVAFIFGCVSYAQGKGQPGIFGLLGLLSIIGLIVLAVLPDHHKEA